MSKRINNHGFEFDVLGDVLETLRFSGSIFFHSKLSAPWGMSLTKNGAPRFHIALSGDFFVGVDDKNTVNVQYMDMVMLPNGSAHWIADSPGRKLIPSEQAGKSCALGQPLFQQGPITNRIMCGVVQYDHEATHPILDAFPQIVHFSNLNSTDTVWSLAILIDIEICQTHDYRSPIIDRLAETLFLQLLNLYINENKEKIGFFAALRNHRVHKILTLIHQNPEFDWSLSSLSEQVGMSRATLIRHFQDTVGVTPMTYVRNWRLVKAYNRIKFSNAPLGQIAELVGFVSARTLSRAFQRSYGCTPNELRKKQSTCPNTNTS